MWAQQKKNNLPRRTSGFTIVELLIVIVVIGVLAAITVVAYNGVQTRAKSTSITSAAQQVQKLLMSYQATYGQYPPQLTSGANCLTVDNKCTYWDGTPLTSDNSALITELRKVGNPPETVARNDNSYYGLYLDYYTPRTFNHAAVPGLLMYWLPPNQTCRLGNTAVSATFPGEPNAFVTSTTGYTNTDSTRTTCWISI